MVNEVFLIGWVLEPPVLTYWETKEKTLAVLRLQVKTNGNKNKTTDVHEVVVFGDEAERVAEIELGSGDVVIVKGRLKSKIINEKQRVHEIYARSVEKMEVSE